MRRGELVKVFLVALFFFLSGLYLGHFMFPVIVNTGSLVVLPSTPALSISGEVNYSFLGWPVSEGVISERLPNSSGNGCFPMVNDSPVIWVNSSIKYSDKLNVLVHEYGHAIQYSRGWVGWGSDMNLPFWQENATEEGSRVVLGVLVS